MSPLGMQTTELSQRGSTHLESRDPSMETVGRHIRAKRWPLGHLAPSAQRLLLHSACGHVVDELLHAGSVDVAGGGDVVVASTWKVEEDQVVALEVYERPKLPRDIAVWRLEEANRHVLEVLARL